MTHNKQKPANKALAASSRRQWLQRSLKAAALAPLLGSAGLSRAKPSVIPTPWQTPGPFYPEQPDANADNDLLRHAGSHATASGQPLIVTGRVLNLAGEAISSAMVELWQCDATGHYHHPADRQRQARDNNFQGYGKAQTNQRGEYFFQTIVPVAYPGRTPHIHFAVTAAGYPRLTTQMYLAAAEKNKRDILYRNLSTAQQQALTVHLSSDEQGRQQAEFTLYLA